MRRTIIQFIWSIIVSGALLAVASAAQAAVMNPSPQTASVDVNDTFIVTVNLDSEREYINAVSATLSYPTDLLEVESVDWSTSFLSMWVHEPSINADAGSISFTGGKPNGTLVVDSPLIRVTFRARTLGTATVVVDGDQSGVYLNDGRGTAAALTTVAGTYTIVNASPYALDITSPTHPDEDTWYSGSIFTAQWQPRDRAFYSYALSELPTTVPDDFVDEPQDSATYAAVADGVHYFILREKLTRDEWQVVGVRRAQIDSTPPLSITAKIDTDPDVFGGRYYLSFGSYDTTSGIDYYEVVEGNQVVSPAVSPYLLTDQVHRQDIVIRAFDRAGNKSETTVVHGGSGSTSRASFDSNVLLLAAVVFAVCAGVLGTMVIRRRKKV